jgi:integrase
MGTIRKRGAGWRAEVRKGEFYQSKDGFETRGAAKLWIATLESRLAANRQFVRNQPHTLADAFERYATDVSTTKKGERWEVVRLRKIARHPIAQIKLGELAPSHLARWRDEQLKILAPASVSRELGLMRSVLEIARREWGWVEINAAKDVRKPPGPKHRQRRVSKAEIQAILINLEHREGVTARLKRQIAAVAFLFALETAMRKSEILSLTWASVDLDTRVATLRDSKNSDRREVPLSARAIALIEMMDEAREPEQSIFRVAPGTLDGAFRDAVRDCAITDLHFHDARHEACTRLAEKLSVMELAAVIGHRDLKSLMIYYNPTGAELARKL